MCVYTDASDFIVMVVGGPNARKDYHYNETEEFFYQVEGDIILRIMDGGTPVNIPIREGEIFLLPPKIPHSPQRPAGTVGLVMELKRKHGERDGCLWFCEKCNHKLHEKYFYLTDIVSQLPPIMNEFYSSSEYRTCQICGTMMIPPA